MLALFVALGGTAYAIDNGQVKARHIADGAVTTPKLRVDAVGSSQVRDFALRLHDLGHDVGGMAQNNTTPVSSAVSVPANECRRLGLRLDNPAPQGLIGSLVVGYITSDQGGAVLNNNGVVVPTMVSETTQGGAIANLMVCGGGSAQTVPAGSIVHWSLVGP